MEERFVVGLNVGDKVDGRIGGGVGGEMLTRERVDVRWMHSVQMMICGRDIRQR